jgi:hypothetical protein
MVLKMLLCVDGFSYPKAYMLYGAALVLLHV